MQGQGRTDSSRQHPSRGVAELIQDFGSPQCHGDSTWVKIHPGRLPSYLRSLPVLEEAMRWTLVISPSETKGIWLRLAAPGRAGQQRGEA